MILKPKLFPKSNVPTDAVNKGKDARNTVVQKPSKGSNKKFEWKIKKDENSFETPRNTVLPETSQETDPPRKAVPKQPIVEYDFWINEKTLTFCIFPKESRKNPSETPTTQKLQVQSLC